ncbi:MAG: hypothetical protein M0Z94_18685 [Dehalococcoidales bacterium]|nr:hypothetical protein [Dehalococcoidales bacterium]
MRDRLRQVSRRLPYVAFALIVAASLVAPPLALARPAAAITFSGLNPAPNSTVPAGEVTIAATVTSTGNVTRTAMALNTQPLSFEVGGPSANVAALFTGRVLAPGEYDVFVAAEDSTGTTQTTSWHFTVRRSDPIPAGFMQVDAKIEIVFPHDGVPVTQASLANIGTVLFTPGTRIPVPCGFDGDVVLWRAINNDPARPIVSGTRIMQSRNGLTYPEWVFNNVDVSAAQNPNNKIYFFVTVNAQPNGTNSNVWVHGADPRTIFPLQDVPSAVQPWPTPPAQLDTKIEIVFPNSPLVRQATRANIGTDIFRLGTLRSVDFSRNPFAFLIRSLNADVATFGAVNDIRISASNGGVVHPRWVFDNIDVSQATTGTPPNLILFRSVVADTQFESFPNVWSHGADVRTFFPIQDVPERSCQP